MTTTRKSPGVDEKIDQLEDMVQDALDSAKEGIARAEESMDKAKEALGDGYGTLRARSAEAYAKAKEYVSDASAALESVREYMGQLYGRSREAIEELYAKAKVQLEKLSEEIKKGYARIKAKVAEIDPKAIRDDVIDYIQRNPGKTILIALAVGFTVGFLVRPREA
ncbi:MAG TPA: hypothetical protein PLS53_06085 [Thermoanaerobaculaceae bacterium]|nr:hypothetical protein [Thermoanaerobaculaceae bacterium]HPS77703.1 hypothetical protein [Thermoanaerobaculaceae bacterium]